MAETKSGWLKIPGMQDGARSLEEQMLGLQPALDEAPGKTVLDLGCAEGLISLEFAKAGAKAVDGCDYNGPFIEVAQQQYEASCLSGVRFRQADITELLAWRGQPKKYDAHRWQPKKYDIVLALAILHKLPDPEEGLRYCAKIAKSLIVIRLPHDSVGSFRSKHGEHKRADVRKILPELGFARERKEIGPRSEWVHYWRRKE